MTIPVFTAIMAVVLLGEKMTVVRWLSFVLAIALVQSTFEHQGVTGCAQDIQRPRDLAGRPEELQLQLHRIAFPDAAGSMFMVLPRRLARNPHQVRNNR